MGFGGLFGQKFRENWKGTADKAGLADKLGVIGVGLSQLSAGQAPNILPVWQAVEDRRAKRKLGDSLSDPTLLAGFTPEQQKMLSVMPPDMAQSLIMEKMFAPPPDPVKPNYDYIDGVGMVDMNNPPADMMAGKYQPTVPTPMTAEEKAMWGLGEGTYVMDPKTKMPTQVEGSVPTNGGAAEYGLQPVLGTDKDGNTVIMQLGKDAGVVFDLVEGLLALVVVDQAAGTQPLGPEGQDVPVLAKLVRHVAANHNLVFAPQQILGLGIQLELVRPDDVRNPVSIGAA